MHRDARCDTWHPPSLYQHAPLIPNAQVQACGSLVTEERPHMLLAPIEQFLGTLGYFRPPQIVYFAASPPRSPPNLLYSLAEFSPKASGLKLKPIKTRMMEPMIVERAEGEGC